MDINHIIEPERHGLWIAGGFIVALVALTMAITALQKTDSILVGTQAEVIVLNNKIESLKANQAGGHPAQAPQAAPAAK
jgi:hypothetical protein